MSTTPSARRRRLALALCAVLFGLPSLRTAAAAAELGAATPEELVARLATAAEGRDFAALAAALAPEDRAAMTLMMILGAGMMVAFSQMGAGLAEGMAEAFEADADADAAGDADAEAGAAAAEPVASPSEQLAPVAARYEELLERHGIARLMEENPEPMGGDPAAAVRLFEGIDQVALIADVMAFMTESFPEETAQEPVPVPAGELTGLVVDGDVARGMVGDEEVTFVRVDGRWFLDLPGPAAAPAEEGGAADPS